VPRPSPRPSSRAPSHWNDVRPELNGPRARRAFRAIAVASVPGAAMTSFGASTSDAATLRETSVNPYCESMIADHPSPPTNNSPIAYHAWAKQNLKYFEHLQSEANMSVAKSSLRVLVPILKVEAKSSNMKSLGPTLDPARDVGSRMAGLRQNGRGLRGLGRQPALRRRRAVRAARVSLRDEVLGHRVMADDRVGRLFGVQLEAFGDRDANALALE